MRSKRFSLVVSALAVVVSLEYAKPVHAVSGEEIQCIAQAYADGTDPSACFKWGGRSGDTPPGSGGATGDGGSTDGGGGGGGAPTKLCTAPSFWFTGPIDPTKVGMTFKFIEGPALSLTTSTAKFFQSVGGKPYVFDQSTDTGDDGITFYSWTVTSIEADGSLGIPIKTSCVD